MKYEEHIDFLRKVCAGEENRGVLEHIEKLASRESANGIRNLLFETKRYIEILISEIDSDGKFMPRREIHKTEKKYIVFQKVNDGSDGGDEWECAQDYRSYQEAIKGIEVRQANADFYGVTADTKFQIVPVEIGSDVQKVYVTYRREKGDDLWYMECTRPTLAEAEKDLIIRRQNWDMMDGEGRDEFQIREVILGE